MFTKISYENPINNQIEELNIVDLHIDYGEWKRTPDYTNDEDIENILNYYISYLDCTREYSAGRPMMTTYRVYSIFVSTYFKFLVKLKNQFTYNKYFDKLIKRHVKNIIFEHDYPYCKPVKTKKKNKKAKPNKFFKSTSIDLFTGKKVYFYDNPKTKEHIESADGNKLSELNAKQISKAIKKSTVPLSSMTFNFKKK